MQDEPQQSSVEALLGHARFVRGVARALLAEGAEDLEQDAWAAALERPPDREPRGWFRAVLRNLRAKALRGGERRERRERTAARPEAQPAAADLAAREETLRAVMEAVLAIDPLHREVVLLRFYEDLPPRAIAARLGVPVNTVRSRLGRALADLRARLDARHGGRRDAWALSVAGLAGIPWDGASWGTGVAMAAKAKAGLAAAALLLLAGGGTWWAMREGPPPGEPAGREVAASVPAGKTLDLTSPDPQAPTGPPTAAPPAGIAEAPAAPARDSVSAAVVVEGIVVDADDRPVEGAQVVLSSPDTKSGSFEESSVTTPADGRFRFTFTGRFAYLTAGKPGWAPGMPAEVAGTPGAKHEVRLVLPGPEGVLEGVVLGPDGNPLPGARVRVGPPDELLMAKPAWWKLRSPDVETDAAGRFRVGALAAGSTEILVRAPRFPPRSDRVTVEAGRTSRIEVRLSPSAAIAGTIRLPDGSPAAGVTVRVVSFLGAPLAARSDGEGRFRLEGLWPGKADAWVDGKDLGHATALLETVAERETRWDPVLSVEPAIRGRLVDEEGRPLEGWWVEAQQGMWDFQWSGAAIRKRRTGPDGSFLLQNLAAGTYAVWAKAEEHGVPSAIREGVRTGEAPIEIRVTADSLPAAGLRGLLRNPDGSIPSEAYVQLWPGPERGSPFVSPSAKFDPSTGEFRNEALPPGRYGLSVWSKAEGPRLLPPVVLQPRKVLDLGEIALGAPGRIRVALLGPIPEDPGTQVLLTLHARSPGGAWIPAGQQELARGAPVPDLPHGSGDVRMRLWGNWVATWERVVQVPSGGEVRVEVPVRRAPMRFLRVCGPGLPADSDSAHVRILDRDGLLHYESRWSRPRGGGEMVGTPFLLPGAWEVELTQHGKDTVRRTVTLDEDDGLDYKDAVPIELP